MNSFAKPSAILVGDEIGQLKRIDLKKVPETTIIHLVPDEMINPSKRIVSIHPLQPQAIIQYFLVARKDHEIFIFNSLTDEVRPIKYIDDNKSPLVASHCIDDHNIAVGFQDGTIKRINVENDLCFAQYKPNSKAVTVLGIDDGGQTVCLAGGIGGPRKKRRRTTENHQTQSSSKVANEISDEKQDILTIHKPDWNVENTYLTCFQTKHNRLAIGGFNCDLKVFDLTTGQSLFGAKSVNTDWLGLRHDIWISGIEWLDQDNVDPHLIATCSRTEPFVRIYDIKQRQRKPAMTINLKHLNNKNNDSNPMSFTTLCSLPSLSHYGQASSSLIVGSTLGRMIALDLRISSQSSKVLGAFKGFSGGSVRDIKHVRDGQLSHQIFSCSLDRFVRVHRMTKTSRLLEKKIYVKTRPTCLYPIVRYSAEKQAELQNDHKHSDYDLEEEEEEEEDGSDKSDSENI